MITLKSLIFTVLLYLESAIIFICLFPLAFFPRRITLWIPILWTKAIRFTLAAVCQIKIKVEGLENLPKQNGYIIASKHQSAMETLLFHSLVPNVFYILKQSLMWLPLANLYAWRTGCIPIDRKGGAKTMRKMLNQASKRLKEGMNLIIFPEGTRVPPTEKKHYSPGVAFLYEQCKVPVVPVALNTGVFWPKNSFIKYPGTVIVRFLPPIQPNLEKRQFLQQLESRIETEQDKLQNHWIKK